MDGVAGSALGIEDVGIVEESVGDIIECITPTFSRQKMAINNISSGTLLHASLSPLFYSTTREREEREGRGEQRHLARKCWRGAPTNSPRAFENENKIVPSGT